MYTVNLNHLLKYAITNNLLSFIYFLVTFKFDAEEIEIRIHRLSSITEQYCITFGNVSKIIIAYNICTYYYTVLII